MTDKKDMPDHGGVDAVVEAQIATLAHRFWTIHPRELQDKGMTREDFYIREMTALAAAISKPAPVAANASDCDKQE